MSSFRPAGGTDGTSTGRDRFRGYKRAMEAAGLEVDPRWRIPGPRTKVAGFEATDAFLALPGKPTAAVCWNDLSAIGLMNGLFRAGLVAGRDVSVTGYDDLSAAALGSLLLYLCISNRVNDMDSGVAGLWRTSVIPFLLWRRHRTVHAIRRGFLRCRKSDSDLPFWKRKILLSPRTKSLPCTFQPSAWHPPTIKVVSSCMCPMCAEHRLISSAACIFHLFQTMRQRGRIIAAILRLPHSLLFTRLDRGGTASALDRWNVVPCQGRSSDRRRCRRRFSFWRRVGGRGCCRWLGVLARGVMKSSCPGSHHLTSCQRGRVHEGCCILF